MWYLTIPIPNWTGFLGGFCSGGIVGVVAMLGVAWWGSKRATKEPDAQELLKRLGSRAASACDHPECDGLAQCKYALGSRFKRD